MHSLPGRQCAHPRHSSRATPDVRGATTGAIRLGLLLGWLGTAALAAAANVDYFADNGYGNPVSTLQHPCGEHVNGVTYVAYSGPHEDPYVAAYDHAQGRWRGPVQAGVNPMGKSPDQIDPGALDNHGRPALVVDRQGYLHLIFGGHGGEPTLGVNRFGTPGKGRQIHVISRRPGDISSWQVVDNVSPFGTYSQWVKLANGDLYLFYRHGSHRSDWVYQKSVDDGRTFSPVTPVLKSKVSTGSPTTVDAWYAWFENGRGDTITAHYNYHPCANPGHTTMRSNAYYMLLNCRDGSWTDVRGQALTLPVTKEYADQATMIWNSGAAKTNHGTARVDADGHPHLYIRQGGVRYFRWRGDAWQGPVAVGDARGRGQDGDFIIESPSAIRMLLAQESAGTGTVCWWTSADGGLSWAREKCVLSLPGVSFEATTLVRNAHPDARMLLGSKEDGTEHLYRKMYLVGDRGPLGRPAAEAGHLGNRLELIRTLPKATPLLEAKRKRRAGGSGEKP